LLSTFTRQVLTRADEVGPRVNALEQCGMSIGNNRDLSECVEERQRSSSEPDFVCTRVLNAPRAVVFRAFIDPDILARWWGPEGFTNTFQEFRPESGGVWRFVMHGPDGTDYRMFNEFTEVVHEERIVLQHHQSTHNFRLEMAYSDVVDNTRLTWRIWFESPEEAEMVRPFLNHLNEQNFDRLEAQLAVREST
jgi:uncharacterized protein YndB with AHSA1/START domain